MGVVNGEMSDWRPGSPSALCVVEIGRQEDRKAGRKGGREVN